MIMLVQMTWVFPDVLRSLQTRIKKKLRSIIAINKTIP